MSDASQEPVVFEGRQVRMSGPVEDLNLLRAEVEEGLSMLTDIDLQFLSSDHEINLDDIIGRRITIEIDDGDEVPRYFQGHCINVWYEGVYEGLGLYRAELRPWLWFLTQTSDCRVFQEISARDIIKQIFNEYGFTDLKDSLRGDFQLRPFCLQYNETDYNFVCRLMEEEGIYFFFDHDASKDTLVLINDIAGHDEIPFTAKNSETDAEEPGKIEFFYKDEDYRRKQDHIFKWQAQGAVLPGKVTFRDYDFEASSADLTSASVIEKGTHSHNKYEIYEYPGTYKTTSEGEELARVKMESKAAGHMTARGVCNVRVIGAGQKFTMINHPRKLENREYLVTRARHQLQIETDYDAEEQTGSIFGPSSGIEDEHNPDTYRCIFEVQTTDNPFRAPHETAWPKIDSLQTATVVGPTDNEIYTDEFGRVKIRFHWDRESDTTGKRTKGETKGDGLSSCFVRVAQQWTGVSWGAIWIPRVGQEVVVQFEEGNPDRPLVTGMLYNNLKKPPYELPTNKTKSGVKTRSTMQGAAETYNELVFEDLKGNEYVRFQSQKDYFGAIRRNAEVAVGFGNETPIGDGEEEQSGAKPAPENYTNNNFKTVAASLAAIGENSRLTKVKNNDWVEVETGDKVLHVKKGNQYEHIQKNREVKVHAEDKLTVVANKTDKIEKDYTIDVGGTLSITAGTKIVLKVGGSTVTIESSKITLSTSGSFEATATGSAKMTASGSAEVTGSGSAKFSSGGILTVQGSMVKIN